MSTSSDNSRGDPRSHEDGQFWIDLPVPAHAPPAPARIGESSPPHETAPAGGETPSVATAQSESAGSAGGAPGPVETPVGEDAGSIANVIPALLGGALALAIAIGLEAAGLWSTLLPP